MVPFSCPRLDAKKGLDLLLEAFCDHASRSAGEPARDRGRGARPGFVREPAATGRRRSGIAGPGAVDRFFSAGKPSSPLSERRRFFTLPSFSENFGVVVAEALAAGAPCVLSGSGGARGRCRGARKRRWRCPARLRRSRGALTRTLTEPDTRPTSGCERPPVRAGTNFSMAAAAALPARTLSLRAAGRRAATGPPRRAAMNSPTSEPRHSERSRARPRPSPALDADHRPWTSCGFSGRRPWCFIHVPETGTLLYWALWGAVSPCRRSRRCPIVPAAAQPAAKNLRRNTARYVRKRFRAALRLVS